MEFFTGTTEYTNWKDRYIIFALFPKNKKIYNLGEYTILNGELK
jgi:hypothetical protein